ncbi:MAG: type IX secretion system membrane protein PorP/SprF, partial [Bacteroidota bacterium]
APVELDMNMNVLVSRILWLGVSLRSEFSRATEKESGILESISGLIAIQPTPQWLIGYSYDFTTTAISTNTHEIILNYLLPTRERKILTPRYF